jgi:hypothetical protein
MHRQANQPLLQRMTELWLQGCELTAVPEEVGLCTGLQKLCLNNNFLFLLPEEIFWGMGALQSLGLFCNQLTSLPEGIFRRLGALQELDLGRNQLTVLPERIFWELGALRKLQLECNRLTFLPERIFWGLDNLQQIFLWDNWELMIFYEDPPWVMNNMELLGVIEQFLNYTCTSPFAKLYQLAAKNAPLEAVQAAFSRLPVGIKIALYREVWNRIDDPAGAPEEWGKHLTFENMPRFQKALKEYVRKTFKPLSNAQRAMVYDPAPFGNVLRLIDAMMVLYTG